MKFNMICRKNLTKTITKT